MQQLNIKKEYWSKLRLVPIAKKYSEITKIRYFLSMLMPSTLIGRTMKFETQISVILFFPMASTAQLHFLTDSDTLLKEKEKKKTKLLVRRKF